MKTYPIPMVPGPVKVEQAVLEASLVNYGSADLEEEFLDLYRDTAQGLGRILGTQNDVVIQTGEGMLALWGALKSCLRAGDRVLSVATGVFGYGIAEMAASIGCEVRTVGLPYDETISDLEEIEKAVDEFRPKMITAVHCETPSGTLNPIADLGMVKENHRVPLLYVDAVASAGGVPVSADEWKIDLCLGGSQKCLSAPAGMAFLSVSERAWEIIDQVNYVGYDALRPFQRALEDRYFPYTPNWQGVAQLYTAVKLLMDEGLPRVFERHLDAAGYCRKGLADMGLSLFPAEGALPSPTVTAVNLPREFSWEEFDRRLRDQGLVVAGSYGPLAGKIFRLGHMGVQARKDLVGEALDVISKVIR